MSKSATKALQLGIDSEQKYEISMILLPVSRLDWVFMADLDNPLPQVPLPRSGGRGPADDHRWAFRRLGGDPREGRPTREDVHQRYTLAGQVVIARTTQFWCRFGGSRRLVPLRGRLWQASSANGPSGCLHPGSAAVGLRTSPYDRLRAFTAISRRRAES